MSKPKIQIDPEYRELTDAEMYENRAGLCIFPFLLGQRASEWLIKHFS